jgi:hypothetical protein
MDPTLVDQVVHEVLYEGYILYPHRASAKKNRRRFTFGGEVARELMRRPLPERVKVDDSGIRGYDLADALMDGCDAILIDTGHRHHAEALHP